MDDTTDPRNGREPVDLLQRLQRFELLRMALTHKTVDEMILHSHGTTRLLTRFVVAHYSGNQRCPVPDFIDLWQRLDMQGRDEVVAFLREVVG